jgi:CubicO group peptidase (beta-lactamase class C family)
MKKILIGLACLLPGIINYAQTADRITGLFQQLHDKGLFNGNVRISENNNTLAAFSMGWRDYDTREKLAANTIFEIASISKPITATAVLQLQEQGLLDIDDPVSKYLQGFPYPAIRIKHLLSHTSGMGDVEWYEKYWKDIMSKVVTNKDLLEIILMKNKPDLLFEPGTHWQYSNLGYQILVLVIEKASSKNYGDYLRENIFKPAGMNRSFVKGSMPTCITGKDIAVPSIHAWNFDCAFSSAAQVERLKPITCTLGSLLGSENIYSTTADLTAFDKALRNHKILGNASQQLAYRPYLLNNGEPVKTNLPGIGESNYGLGWFSFIDQGMGRVVWHTGGSPGITAIFLRNLSKKQSVVVTNNNEYGAICLAGVAALKMMNQVPPPYQMARVSLAQPLGCALESKGMDEALAKFNLMKSDTVHYRFSENELNELGYHFLFNEKTDKALIVFKLNTQLFPHSWNAFDSYGEALLKANNKENAVLNYERSLELNPENENAKEIIKKLKE